MRPSKIVIIPSCSAGVPMVKSLWIVGLNSSLSEISLGLQGDKSIPDVFELIAFHKRCFLLKR